MGRDGRRLGLVPWGGGERGGGEESGVWRELFERAPAELAAAKLFAEGGPEVPGVAGLGIRKEDGGGERTADGEGER